MKNINIKTPAGIRRVIRQYGPWTGGKTEALSFTGAETTRSFMGSDGTSIVLFFAPDEDEEQKLYWLEIWPSLGAFSYTVDLNHRQYDQIEDLLLRYSSTSLRQRTVKFNRRCRHGKR